MPRTTTPTRLFRMSAPRALHGRLVVLDLAFAGHVTTGEQHFLPRRKGSVGPRPRCQTELFGR
eukprot:853031-Prymnesium_polylepis.1